MEHTQTSQSNKTCLLYGEGPSEKKILSKIKKLDKFQKYYAKEWTVSVDNTSGGNAGTVLKSCRKDILGLSYDLVICFIDTDVLKDEYGRKWKDKQLQLEKEYSEIKIFWQDECLEDELCRSFDITLKSKGEARSYAIKNIEKVIHGEYWKRLIEYFKE